MPQQGGRREGAGRPKGSGTGPTTESKGISMPPKTWQLIDEMRGSSSRGVFISVAIYRYICSSLNNNHRLAIEPSSEPSAKLAAEYALIDRKTVLAEGSAGARLSKRGVKDRSDARRW